MSFVNNARVMLIGYALAQAMPLLASPLLTRLFSPDAFGLQTLFVSATSVILVFATLRLDLAVVLAEDRREAMWIVSVGAMQAALVTTLVFAVTASFAPAIATALGHPGQTAWVWVAAPMVLALAMVQLAAGLLTWQKRFGPASQAQIINQAGYLLVAIGLGFWASPVEGLVAAKLAGQGAAALILVLMLRGLVRDLAIPPRPSRAGLWTRCRPFIVFNTPYSLVGALGREVPVFAFSAVAAMAAAGHYGLARTLLGAPATLLAASLSQVFYREAAEHRGTERLQRLTFALLRVTMTASAPAIALVMVWGDTAFALAFGSKWITAGQYAMILALPAWLSIQTAWPERLYESVARQGISFAIQVTFDALAAVTVFTAVWAEQSAMTVVVLFAIINTTFHIVYLTGMVRVAGFSLAAMMRAAGAGLAVLGLAVGTMTACRLLPVAQLSGFIIAAVIATVATSLITWRGYRSNVSSSYPS